mmetsp:Transcript_2714/g.6795  ORF Transcript_2714/g.6795 Transcript_2714/m.6795 type:complete len:123 (-) Transcript_2714:394-762(-)
MNICKPSMGMLLLPGRPNREQEHKRFFCPPGQIIEMATVMFGSKISAIKDILTDPGAYEQKRLISIGPVFYVLTIITSGTTFPSRIFSFHPLFGSGGVVCRSSTLDRQGGGYFLKGPARSKS